MPGNALANRGSRIARVVSSIDCVASLPGLTQPFKGSESQAVNINFQDSGKLSISAEEAFPGEFAAEPSASASTMVSGIKI